MVANVVQVSMAMTGSRWASVISAMLALDSTVNQIAIVRVGQRRAHSSAPAAAPAAAAIVQAS